MLIEESILLVKTVFGLLAVSTNSILMTDFLSSITAVSIDVEDTSHFWPNLLKTECYKQRKTYVNSFNTKIQKLKTIKTYFFLTYFGSFFFCFLGRKQTLVIVFEGSGTGNRILRYIFS